MSDLPEKMTSAEIDFHKRKIDELWQDIREFGERLFKFYENESDKIRELAKHYEALILAGQMDITVNDICAFIISKKDEFEIDVSDQWIRRCLDKKYKRGYDSEERKHVSNTTEAEIPKILQKPIAAQSTAELVEAVEVGNGFKQLFKDREQEIEERTKERITELKNRGYDTSKFQKEVETTREADPKETESYKAALKHARTWVAIADEIYRFPPTPEDDKEIAAGINGWDALFVPSGDKKFTQSMPDWFDMLDYFYGHGKHAAGKQWAVEKPMILYNKETDSYDIIPIEPRKYTREHVGDHAAIIEATRENFYKSIPVIAAIIRWHRDYAEPPRGERKNRMGIKLANLKFGGGGNLDQ